MNVLFLCTGNSARSLLAEALLNHLADEEWHGYSAGSQPKGEPHPMALEVLQSKGLPSAGLSSKSWDVFATAGAPEMDMVITVCDNAAGESCPIWPGKPHRLHWSLPDPAAVTETDALQRQAFEDTYASLKTLITDLLNEPR